MDHIQYLDLWFEGSFFCEDAECDIHHISEIFSTQQRQSIAWNISKYCQLDQSFLPL